MRKISELQKPKMKELATLLHCSVVNVFIRLQKDVELNGLYVQKKFQLEQDVRMKIIEATRKLVLKDEEEEDEEDWGEVEKTEDDQFKKIDDGHAKRLKEIEQPEEKKEKKEKVINQKEWDRCSVSINTGRSSIGSVDFTDAPITPRRRPPSRVSKIIRSVKSALN